MTEGQGSTILFAGGGSGGHISPGLAIAERLAEQSPPISSHFACSTRTIDATMLEEARVAFTPMPATPPALSPRAALRFASNYRRTISATKRLIAKHGIAQVVALGGFVAAPVVAGAMAARIPVTLINLDNPPGRANRLMARKCRAPRGRVWSAVDLPDHPGFASETVGMPIRRRAIASKSPQACRQVLGLDPDRLTLLITGASQGASTINDAILALAKADPGLFTFQVIHLAGPGRDQQVRAMYEKAGIDALVLPFLHDMGLAWGAADLAISRSGASSVAEVAHNAIPTIFMPYPHHADDHQRRNATPLEATGGVILMTDHINPETNARALKPLIHDLMTESVSGRGQSLDTMRRSLEAAKPPDAAAIIAARLTS